jgi:hypothetical protein
LYSKDKTNIKKKNASVHVPKYSQMIHAVVLTGTKNRQYNATQYNKKATNKKASE